MAAKNAKNSVRSVASRTAMLLCLCLLNGCVGAVVGAAVDTTIEVAKVPFKVAGAAVDLVVPDGDDEE